jgi:hypothetical protein
MLKINWKLANLLLISVLLYNLDGVNKIGMGTAAKLGAGFG